VAAERGLTVGLHRRTTLATFLVTGADRVDYLQRMLTQDLRGLAAGHATYACLLTPKGRIVGDLLLWHVGDHLLLETEAPAVLPVLERYVIADDVAFEDVTSQGARYVLFGSQAAQDVVAARLPVPGDGAFEEAEVGGRPARVLTFGRRGLSCFEMAVAPEAAPALEALLDLVPDADAYAAACIRHGIPRFGPELGEDVLFNEAGLEEAVSWKKGCFPGQEPVVMARDRGHPPRRLASLTLEEPAPAGADVVLDGKVVGRLTSVAPGQGGAAALAYLKYDVAVAGARFDVAGGIAVASPPGEEVW